MKSEIVVIRRARRTPVHCALLAIAVAHLLPACAEDSDGESQQPIQPTASNTGVMPGPAAPVGSMPAPAATAGQPPAAVTPSVPQETPAVPAMPSAGGGEPMPAPVSTTPETSEPEPVDDPGAAGAPAVVDAGAPADVPQEPDAVPDAGGAETPPEGESGLPELPDPGTEGDGDYEVGPNAPGQPEVGNQGNPKGKRYQFSMRLADSKIFDGTDSTLDPSKPVNDSRSITVYVPAQYQDGTPAPVLVIQDGPGPIDLVSNALDNMTVSNDPQRKLPPFVAIGVQNGGNDAQGSERGLEYDTMSDRYARFIDEEVLPAVASHAALRADYPDFSFTTNPSGRGALGCSSGGAAAFTMAWFRPDLFSRVVAYSTTLVDQQDEDAPENAMYPDGAWDYHSELELIANSEKKPIRFFINVNENDLRSTDPESTFHNWVMANERTAEDLAAKGYHYRFVLGRGAGHCDFGVQQATMADALAWVWRGYEPTGD